MNLLKQIDNKRFFISFQSIVFLFFLLNCFFHKVSFFSIVTLFLYQFFIWFLSGYALLSILKLKFKSFIETTAISYALGCTASIVVYLIVMTLDGKNIFPYIFLIQSVVVTAYLYKYRLFCFENYEKDYAGSIICPLFLVSFYVLTFFSVSLLHSLPDETLKSLELYVDWPFWVGNNIAFTNSFPADCFRQIGEPFKYHYFSSILMACISLSSSVDVNIVSFYFSPVFSGIIFTLSAYFFASCIIQNKLLIFVIMLALIYTDGTTVSYAWHTNICPFGFDYGYSFCMLAIGILARILLEKRFNDYFLLSCIIIAVDTGFKGPLALGVLIAYGCATLFILFENLKKGFIAGILWLLSFSIVYLVVIHSPGVTGKTGLHFIGGFSIDTIVMRARWIAEIFEHMTESDPSLKDNMFIKLYSIWKYIFRANKFAVLLLAVSVAYFVLQIVKNRKISSLLFCLIIASFVNIGFAVYFTQIGSSQMYFLMGMFPHAILAGGYSLSLLCSSFKFANLNKTYKSAVCVFLAILIGTLGVSVKQYMLNARSQVWYGVKVLLNLNKLTSSPYSIDYIDYEACLWLRNSSKPDDVVAVIDTTKANYTSIGIFTQRYVWNETKYVPNLEKSKQRNSVLDKLNEDLENTVEVLKKNGVGYILINNSDIKSGKDYICKSISKVFNNEHYSIYRIL